MKIAKLIMLIEQQGERFTDILNAFQSKEITSKEVLEFILEFLSELKKTLQRN